MKKNVFYQLLLTGLLQNGESSIVLIRRPCLALPTNERAVNIVYPVSANQEADTRPAPPLVLCIRKELFKCRLTLAEYTFVIEMMVLEISEREKEILRNIFSSSIMKYQCTGGV